jgi:Protein of unknown function (DUF642)/PEP-CTERM motif
MLRPSALFTAFVASLLAGHAAQAAGPNLLVNGSFEQGNFVANVANYPGGMQLFNGSTVMDGWTVGGELAWLTEQLASVAPQQGTYALDLTGFCDLGNNGPTYCQGFVASGTYGSVSQTLGTVAGASYRLSFQGGTYTYPFDANYRAPTLVVNAGSATQSHELPDDAPATGSWTLYSLDFTATDSSTVISFSGSGGVTGHTFYLGIDNAAVELLSLPVPEPTTYALLLAGLGLVGVAARRRAASTTA